MSGEWNGTGRQRHSSVIFFETGPSLYLHQIAMTNVDAILKINTVLQPFGHVIDPKIEPQVTQTFPPVSFVIGKQCRILPHNDL